MAKPRVFISSTFYDLRHIRSSIENFVECLGFEPILSEKGVIAYNPDLPLDESCYREAESSDIFVLIIGGRYGSPSSVEKRNDVKDFFERYESITKMEYDAASNKDIPIYILIEKAVYSEYDTFKNNRTNNSIKYAQVDSINIFYLIEKILNQPRNNPIHTFEKHQEIEIWLKEQWAGLFRDLLSKRSEKNKIASLSKQVEELSEINTTLKRYLEVVVSKVSVDNAAKIIKDETERLQESKKIKEFEESEIVQDLLKSEKVPIDKIIHVYKNAKYLDDIASFLEKESLSRYSALDLLNHWNKYPHLLLNINKPRIILGLAPLTFSNKLNTLYNNKKR